MVRAIGFDVALPILLHALGVAGIARRHDIAGTLATTPENLARWIEAPQAIEPGTAMPDLGLSSDTLPDPSSRRSSSAHLIPIVMIGACL